MMITLTGAGLDMAGAHQGITPAPVWVWLALVKVLRRNLSVVPATVLLAVIT
jgi:hypothetical protein